jgi:hypothetical protein
MATNEDLNQTLSTNPQSNTQSPGNTALNTGNIAPTQPFQIPQTQDAFNSYIQGLLSNAGLTQGNLTQQLTQQQGQQQNSADKALSTYLGSLTAGSATQDYTDLSGQFKMRENQNSLNNLNQQIASRTGQLAKAVDQAEQTNAFDSFAQGEQNRIKKQAAIELGALTASAQALQGNLELSRSTIKDILQLKEADRSRKIEATKAFYEVNKDKLDKTDSALLQSKIRDDEREQKKITDLNDFKEKAALTASQNGAPASVTAAIINAEDKGAALKAMGGYGVDELDRQLKKAQLSKIYADIAESKRQAEKGKLKPLSGEAAKVLSISTTLPKDIEKIKTKLGTTPESYQRAIRGYLFGTDRELVRLINNAADKVGRLRSGGAINKDEEIRFKQQFASAPDLAFGTLNIASNGLDGIVVEANLVSDGIDPDGYYAEQLGTSLDVLAGTQNNTQYTPTLDSILKGFTVKNQ